MEKNFEYHIESLVCKSFCHTQNSESTGIHKVDLDRVDLLMKNKTVHQKLYIHQHSMLEVVQIPKILRRQNFHIILECSRITNIKDVKNIQDSKYVRRVTEQNFSAVMYAHKNFLCNITLNCQSANFFVQHAKF